MQHKEKDFYHDKKTRLLKISIEANHYYYCKSSSITRRHFFHARLLQLDKETLVKTAQASELRPQFRLGF